LNDPVVVIQKNEKNKNKKEKEKSKHPTMRYTWQLPTSVKSTGE
jgi:hypothetical protein